MTDKFSAAQWAEIEGGHEVTPVQEESYSFLRDLHESRMTKDNGNAKKLTYTDCGERINEMNENDVVVFNNFEDADNYVNGLEGSPKIIETELK